MYATRYLDGDQCEIGKRIFNSNIHISGAQHHLSCKYLYGSITKRNNSAFLLHMLCTCLALIDMNVLTLVFLGTDIFYRHCICLFIERIWILQFGSTWTEIPLQISPGTSRVHLPLPSISFTQTQRCRLRSKTLRHAYRTVLHRKSKHKQSRLVNSK